MAIRKEIPMGRLAVPAAIVLLAACDGSGPTLFDLLCFRLENTEQFSVCGIALDSLDSLSPSQIAGVLAAWAEGQVPVDFTLNIGVRNPNNGIVGPLLEVATIVEMPWSLYMDDSSEEGFDTAWVASGTLLDPVEVPGDSETVIIPLEISFDALQVLESAGPMGLIDLVLAVGGIDGDLRDEDHLGRLLLNAEPSVETPFGSMEYPGGLWVWLDWSD
jgi:hypothetical protein